MLKLNKKWGAADGSKSKIQIQHLLKLNVASAVQSALNDNAFKYNIC